MTQMYSLDKCSSSSLAFLPHPEVPPVTMPPTSHPQCPPREHIGPLCTLVTTSPPLYSPESVLDISRDVEADIGPKITVKQVAPRPRYSCRDFLTDIYSLIVSLAFVALVCTILVFAFGTVFTDIGAHLLSWDHHDELLVILTWPYSLAAVVIGSIILGSILAFVFVLLGMNAPNAIMEAPPKLILTPCAFGGVFALPMGLTAFPRSAVPGLPFTWKDALNASSAGFIGCCLFILICTLAFLAGTLLMSTVPQRQLFGRAKNVHNDSPECAV